MTVMACAFWCGSLNNIDQDGQELRYASNRNGEKSLQDKSLCNLVIIQESLSKLQELLTHTKYRLIDFIEERHSGTYTPDCSRKDLMRMSSMLPPFSEWKSHVFDKAKEKIKKEYGIGSNKFSDAVDKIKNNRTMAACLGKELPLAHITDEKIKAVLKEWREMHPVSQEDNSLGTDYFDPDQYDKMKAYMQKKSEVLKSILDRLGIDDIADLEAVFYIGRDNLFCECYDKKLEDIKKQHKVNAHLEQEVRHLIEKTSLLDGLIKGLDILGKKSLAEEIKLTFRQ